MSFRIFIDADSCPRAVRDYTIRYTKSNLPSAKVILAANKEIPCQEKDFEMVVLEKGKDSADNWILENAIPGDLIITKDILFAEKLVNKEIAVINDRGKSFTKENIKDAVDDRNFDFQLAMIGLGGSKKHSYSKKNLDDFIKCFQDQIKKLNS